MIFPLGQHLQGGGCVGGCVALVGEVAKAALQDFALAFLVFEDQYSCLSRSHADPPRWRLGYYQAPRAQEFPKFSDGLNMLPPASIIQTFSEVAHAKLKSQGSPLTAEKQGSARNASAPPFKSWKVVNFSQS
jgi:hypothetical protein